MYTGVRLRSNPECGPLPPVDCDLQLPFIESQLLAKADPNDPRLVTWQKHEAPFLPLPPPSLPLTGWRDPFVIQRGGGGKDWIILMGAGLKGEGGTTLIYRAKDLYQQWTYDGLLCLGDPELGAMWECPLLCSPAAAPRAQALQVAANSTHLDDHCALIFGSSSRALQTEVLDGAAAPHPVDPDYSHFYCVSPDAPTNPVLYFMGAYDHEKVKFRLADAVGPFRLDLGDTLYAPNILEDELGRHVLWVWVQERRKVGTYDYAGCMATPRVLLQRDSQLFCQPLPEITKLRSERSVLWNTPVQLPESMLVPMAGVCGRALDMELTFERGNSLITGFILQSYNAGGEGAAAVLYDWESRQLEVVFEALDPETLQFSLSAPNARRIGGKIEHRSGEKLHLRVLLDHSLLEIFTGNGQTLTTRVYRNCPLGTDPGIDFLSIGGMAKVNLAAWEMSTIWQEPQVAKTPKAASLSGLTGKIEALDIGQDLAQGAEPLSNASVSSFQQQPLAI